MSKKRSLPAGPGAGSTAPDTPAMLRAVTRWLKGVTVLIVGSWVLLGLNLLPRNKADTRGAGAGSDSTAGTRPVRSTHTSTGKGPWGRLRYLPITISPPLELVSQLTPLSSREVQWHFPNTISARLPALLSEIGLSEPLREKLVSLAEVNPKIEGLTIRPTREIVLGLSPEQRSALYVLLNGFRENVSQRRAFRFCGNSLDEWLGDSPLSPKTKRLIEPLIYRYGSFLFFADLGALEESLPSPAQRLLLIKALSHESTFLLRLEFSEESNLEELVEYWGRGGRAKDVRPILESLLSSKGERSIDIIHLLPPFARCRLYTYHAFLEDTARYNRDCHWTALNFFSDQPDDRFCDRREVLRALREEYRRVYGDLRLGDVVAFFDQKIQIHSAVFIADDVLLTKNGSDSSHPWMLMKLDDMKSYYPRRRELQIVCFRRKDL